MKKALLKEIMQNAQEAKALEKLNANLCEFLKVENQNKILQIAQRGGTDHNIKMPYHITDDFLAKLAEEFDLEFSRAYYDNKILIVKWSD